MYVIRVKLICRALISRTRWLSLRENTQAETAKNQEKRRKGETIFPLADPPAARKTFEKFTVLRKYEGIPRRVISFII